MFKISFVALILLYLIYQTLSQEDVGEPLFLTPLIEHGKIYEAQHLSQIDLRDLDFVNSHSGFITVNKTFNSNLFFWYFEAAESPDDAPLLIWLQGGPGHPALFGILTEHGPFEVTESWVVKPREYSWHRNYHMLYIDNPVGAGFSFTEDDDGYANSAIEIGHALYEFMRQFYLLFPKLAQHELYLTGESYAGKYIPALAHVIHTKNTEVNQSFTINLQGIAIGSAWSDPITQVKAGDYLYYIGLIDENTLKEFHDYEESIVNLIKSGNFEEALIMVDQYQASDLSAFSNVTGFKDFNVYNYALSNYSHPDMVALFTNSTWRKALHVGNRTFYLNKQNEDDMVVQHLANDFMDSVAPFIEKALEHYRVLFYAGQLDIVCSYHLIAKFLSKLNWSGQESFNGAPRTIWRVDDDVAGYVKQAGNLTEVLVRNAGHYLSRDQPKRAFDIIRRFTQKKSFSP